MADLPRSNREKKRRIAIGVRELLARPGWNPHEHVSGLVDVARQAIETNRAENAFNNSEKCPECAILRRESGDPTAMCERHLAEAMGL